MSSSKVAIIIPYFGRFPIWMDLYLYSCSRQENVDFLFYTDCDFSNYNKYKNIVFISITYGDYCKKISSFLNIDFCPENPYKIVDVRPFLGMLHDDDLVNYDWWGYADIDVLYGDLSILINSKNLHRYDVITTHADRLAGHFTIIRKASRYTQMGYNIDKWRTKLEDPRGLGVDEHDFTKVIRPGVTTWFRVYRFINKIVKIDLYDFFTVPNLILRTFSRIHIKEYNTSDRPKDGEVWVYDIDKCSLITPQGKKLPYLHFLFFKKTPFWNPKNYWKDDYWKIDCIASSGRVLISNKKVVYESESC